jgi:hypothetical protein
MAGLNKIIEGTQVVNSLQCFMGLKNRLMAQNSASLVVLKSYLGEADKINRCLHVQKVAPQHLTFNYLGTCGP